MLKTLKMWCACVSVLVFALSLCVCVTVCACTQGRYIKSGGEVGVSKAFDGKFSVKYKDDPTGGRTQALLSLREGYGKDKHWVLLRLLGRDSA